MSNNIYDAITNLLDCGSPISNIVLALHATYHINVSWQTIYNIRTNQVAKLLEKCSDDPQGSSVDRLLAIFKCQKNVSFVYTLHNFDSGFVTYRKSKKKKLEKQITNDNTNLCENTVKDWRESLKLDNTNDVLVAFAWAHDDELKSAEMFPEFFAADITYGVNKEKRDLFLVVGIDGNNKVFSAFRCFIPSKQQHSYTWIVDEAMPHLLSSRVLKFNNCISTDQEMALNKSIETAIDSNKAAFSNSNLRLDCFHFFTLPWLSEVHKHCKKTDNANEVLQVLYKWIMTWFRNLESQNEFDISYHYFIKYLEGKYTLLGDPCLFEINKIVKNIVSKKKMLLNHYFLEVTTFDFIGDSIVESANAPIKKGTIKVSNNMELSNSGYTLLKATKANYHKKKIKNAKSINTKKTWSISLTSNYLTDYAEGLACSMFERRLDYTTRRTHDKMWIVVHSSLFQEDYNLCYVKRHKSPTKFIRVRKVTIDQNNSFINCSCGYPKRWLMPCVHICCVINNKYHYTAELFHLRWWKFYQYLYQGDIKTNKNANTKANMQLSLSHTRNNHYDNSSGTYKGVPINGSCFKEQTNSTLNQSLHIVNDSYMKTMQSIMNMENDNKPLIKGSLSYSEYEIDDNNSDDISHNFDIDDDSSYDSLNELSLSKSNDVINPILIGSQVESNLSSQRLEMNQHTNSTSCQKYDTTKSSNAYPILHPIFSDMVQQIHNKDQLDRAMCAIQKLSFDFKSEAMPKNMFPQGHTSMLGEVYGSRRQEKRHKYSYELKK